MLMTIFKVNEIENLCLISRNCTCGDETYNFQILFSYIEYLFVEARFWRPEVLSPGVSVESIQQ